MEGGPMGLWAYSVRNARRGVSREVCPCLVCVSCGWHYYKWHLRGARHPHAGRSAGLSKANLMGGVTPYVVSLHHPSTLRSQLLQSLAEWPAPVTSPVSGWRSSSSFSGMEEPLYVFRAISSTVNRPALYNRIQFSLAASSCGDG